MKFTHFALAAGLCTWLCAETSVPQVKAKNQLTAQGESVESWLAKLSSDEFLIREQATRELWALGQPIQAALEIVAAGSDPESAYRASDLLRKIQLGITPATDPEVILWVEQYPKAKHDEKLGIFTKLQRKRAWKPLLNLYATETDPEIMTARLRSLIHGVAVTAARECLVRGDSKGARELLELAPADSMGLLALADFHQGQQTLDVELRRAQTLKGPQGLTWQLALCRVAGKLDTARDLALELGQPQIAAAMSALAGDPLPWLSQGHHVDTDLSVLYHVYTRLAAQQWLGNALSQADLSPLLRALSSKKELEREMAISSLFLLGFVDPALDALVQSSSLDGFSYFETLDQNAKALELLGINPQNPDFSGWVKPRFEKIAKADVNDPFIFLKESYELILIANFLTQRGQYDLAEQVFSAPLLAIAEMDQKRFFVFLGALLGSEGRFGARIEAAPELAKRLAISWATDNENRWDDLIAALFENKESEILSWSWLGELDAKASLSERFSGMLALHGLGCDPDGMRDRWLQLAWATVEKVAEKDRPAQLKKIQLLVSTNMNSKTRLRLGAALPEELDGTGNWSIHVGDLAALDRWKDAADYVLKLVERELVEQGFPDVALRACAAACLRRAGRDEEASQFDRLVEKLALGSDLLNIAEGYGLGYDFTRAAWWYAKLARQCEVANTEFENSLYRHLMGLKQQSSYEQAASVCEVLAEMAAAGEGGQGTALERLQVRYQARLYQAAARFKKDRSASLAMFGACFEMYPSDGALADDFYPVLRKLGVKESYERWFDVSWKRVTDVISIYPDSDNSCNTAAWLAARAGRRLDEAIKIQQQALSRNPSQAAYLDTMAEVYFAKGDRRKALEWSAKAVNELPSDRMLRLQQVRFQTEPLPK